MISNRRLIVVAVLFIVALPLLAADPVPFSAWIDSPEAYFATPEEREAWKKVSSREEADRFVEEYWKIRGAQFRKDIRGRIERADEMFSLGSTPGSRTPKGRVWIILGSPNREQGNRGNNIEGTAALPGTAQGGVFQNNSIERGAFQTTTWFYRKDRLPAELGVPEMTVNFQTHNARQHQSIENPGLIEPFLKRAGAYWSQQAIKATAAASTNQPMTAPATATAAAASGAAADPLWNMTPSLNGAAYTGEAYVSARDNTYYATSLFLPSSEAKFNEWTSGLLVTLVRDASGKQVLSDRKQVDLREYDADKNRFVDRSFALPAGTYEVMLALYSPDGATLLSSHREQIDIPAVATPRATKLLLTSRIDTFDQQQELDAFTFVAQKYAVRGNRRFHISDKIGFFTVVANPTGSPAPNLMQKMTFTRDGQPFFKSPLEPAQLVQTGPNSFLVGVNFDPDTFKPGHYTLELQLRDFNAPEGSELRTKGYVLNTEFDVVK